MATVGVKGLTSQFTSTVESAEAAQSFAQSPSPTTTTYRVHWSHVGYQ